MKKVLILLDSAKAGMSGVSGYTQDVTTAYCIKVLETLNIPIEIGWSSAVAAGDITAEAYALVIMPRLYKTSATYRAYADGSLAVPVFVAWAYDVANYGGGAWVSGATARNTQSGDTSLGSSWGLVGYPDGGYIYTMDDTDTNVTKLVYADDGKCAFWKRRGTAGDVYFWGDGVYGPALPLTHALAQVYTVGEVRYPIFTQIDHPDDCDDDAAHRQCLQDYSDWFRARGAVVAAGIKPCVWYTRSAAMKAILRDNQDVLIPHIHRHAPSNPLQDDATYPTAASKIAKWDLDRAILAEDGVICQRNGSLGSITLPNNTISMLGTMALAELGITAFRAMPDVFTFYRVGENVVLLHEVDGSLQRVVGRACSSGLFAYHLAKLEAEEWTSKGATTMHGYRYRMQLYYWTSMFRQDAPIVGGHGSFNLKLGTGYDNIYQMFLDVLDVAVKAGSPIVRWATAGDLANMADLYRRRASWR